MNIYFRFLFILIKACFVRQQSIFTPSILTFHVMPTDCDFNLHLTNSRYLSFMDLGRIYLLGRGKLFKKLFQLRWAPVLAACEITFLRPLKPGAKFNLITRLVYWDEKYFYFEQRFEHNEVLYALALAKGLFVKGNKNITTSDFIHFTGDSPEAFTEPDTIKHWKAMTVAKRKQKNVV